MSKDDYDIEAERVKFQQQMFSALKSAGAKEVTLSQPQVICAECGQVTFGCIVRGSQRYCFPCATKGADLG